MTLRSTLSLPLYCEGCGTPTTGRCATDCGMSLCGAPLCQNCVHLDTWGSGVAFGIMGALAVCFAAAGAVLDVKGQMMSIPETINIRIEKGKAGLYHGVSDDMPSLLVSGESVEEVRAAAAQIVKSVFEARGEPVPRVKVDELPFPPKGKT